MAVYANQINGKLIRNVATVCSEIIFGNDIAIPLTSNIGRSGFFSRNVIRWQPFAFTIDTSKGDGSNIFEFPVQFTTAGAKPAVCTVDWGDGTIDQINSGATPTQNPASHTYGAPGTYTIRLGHYIINGAPTSGVNNNRAQFSFDWNITGANLGITGYAAKIISVDYFGPFFNTEAAHLSNFAGCTNLLSVGTDSPQGRHRFSPPNPSFTGSQLYFTAMFKDASQFDQDLGAWDISYLVDAAGMFDNSGLSTANYDALLNGWAAQSTINSGVALGAAGINYTTATSGAAHTLLTGTYGWTITDAGGI